LESRQARETGGSSLAVAHFVGSESFIISAKEYSIHSYSLDGDEFGIVGASPTMNCGYKDSDSAFVTVVWSWQLKYNTGFQAAPV
jgi:hypothetical protein